MSSDGQKRLPFYQGWLVLVGAFIAHMFGSIAHTTFGFFSVPAAAELDISRADANTWLIVMGFGSALLAPIAGRLIDRVSLRLIMAIGAVVLAASFIAISQTNSLWLMLVLAIPVAFASDGAGGIAANTAVARWFRRRRGRALALVGIATTASGVVLLPIIAYLIVTYGWRMALVLLGIAGGVVILLMVALLIRSRPTEEQLSGFGELSVVRTEEEDKAENRVWTYRELLTNRNFLLLAFGAGLLFASDRALLQSVAPYMADINIDLQKASLLASVLLGSSIGGKLIVGFLADYVDPRKIFLVVAVLHVLLLIMFTVQPDFRIMLAVSLVVGLGIGGVLPTYQVLTASVFGSATYGTVIGTAVVVHQLLMAGALRFIGEVRDRTGSYDLAFQIFIVMVLISAFLIWQVRVPKRERPRQQPVPVPAE